MCQNQVLFSFFYNFLDKILIYKTIPLQNCCKSTDKLPMKPIVEVNNLTKDFSGFVAVKDLSFTVNQGDVYGFLGQNGAGKSTTLRMLLTLISPGSGTMKLFGRDLTTDRTNILRRTGAVIERPDLYKYLTAIENLSIFARLSGCHLNRQQLITHLDRVGLADRAKSRVSTFSQGMKQRLGIAVALVHEPDLVILDEPTNGLDPQGIADMRQLIVSLSRDAGKTVIVSSHLLGEMEQIATRMIIMDKGRKIVEGDMKDLLDPEQLMLQVGLDDPSRARDWLGKSVWKDHPVEFSADGMAVSIAQKDIPRIARELIEAGFALHFLHPRNTLEHYFLSLTGNTDVVTD